MWLAATCTCTEAGLRFFNELSPCCRAETAPGVALDGCVQTSIQALVWRRCAAAAPLKRTAGELRHSRWKVHSPCVTKCAATMAAANETRCFHDGPARCCLERCSSAPAAHDRPLPDSAGRARARRCKDSAIRGSGQTRPLRSPEIRFFAF